MLYIFLSLLIDLLDQGRLPLYKNLSLKFRMERYFPDEQTRPKSPRASMSSEPTKELAVRMRQKSGTGNKNVVKFRSERSG